MSPAAKARPTTPLMAFVPQDPKPGLHSPHTHTHTHTQSPALGTPLRNPTAIKKAIVKCTHLKCLKAAFFFFKGPFLITRGHLV